MKIFKNWLSNYSQCGICKNPSIFSFFKSLSKAKACGVDKSGLSNLLSVEILGHATWMKASIPFRFCSRSFVMSVKANN